MTKICMLSTGHDPLDDRIYYKETLSLVKRFFPIVLVMPGRGDDFKNSAGVAFVPLNNSSSLLSRLLAVPRSIGAVLKIKPDVCHFHDYELIFILPFLKLFSRCKTIYDVHEVYPEMVLDSKKLPRMLLPCVAKIVDMSEKVLARLSDIIVTADENITAR
ncbi:MAG: glycosyltransferase family 1 protein, partial [Nitrospirota bacterium]